MCDKDSGEGTALRGHRSLTACSGAGDVSGPNPRDKVVCGLRTGVFRTRSALRLLQRPVLYVRADSRAKRQPGGMHPGVPVALRPCGRRWKRTGAEQGLTFAEGLQPQGQAERPCGSGNMLVQDRGKVEEHLLRAECRPGIFLGIG